MKNLKHIRIPIIGLATWKKSRSVSLNSQKKIILLLAIMAMFAIVAGARITQTRMRDAKGRLRSALTVDQLAEMVYRPTVTSLIHASSGELAEIRTRLRPVNGMSISGYFHALHLFGVGLTTPDGALHDGSAPVVDVLLDVPRASELFGEIYTLVATRYGVRSPLIDGKLLGTNQSGSQSHRGQFLSTLGSLGILPSRQIRLADGSCQHVYNILDDLIANFTMDGELAWDTIALALYADKTTWVNRYGKAFSFDELVSELSEREPGKASCQGIHDLIALTVLLKTNKYKTILSETSKNKLTAYLSLQVNRAKSTQLQNGSWNLLWHKEQSKINNSKIPKESHVSMYDAMLVTGHLLEWQILLPDSVQAEADVLRRGASWIASSLRNACEDPERLHKLYCPLIHATRSLQILSRKTESPRG